MSHELNPPEGRIQAPRVSFFTFGCRLNQHDTAAMRRDLAASGWACGGDGDETGADTGAEISDVVVVNTCTVTRRADQEARQWIRRVARERPGARIVVTGCYAQRAPEEVRDLPGVAMVLGTAERETIGARLAGLAGEAATTGPAPIVVAPGRARRPALPGSAPLEFGRARALLKVQDGCDTFCGYCIVPYVRGRSRSFSREDVLERARRLLDAGYRELVLTGADLGDYRDEYEHEGALAGLVEAILSLPSAGVPHRVRLSSIEPHKVDDPLLRLLASEPRLCRHLHLPLQSGSSAVLRAMRRRYEPADYAALVERAAAAGPIAIGADVIVGFPGEGEREFEETAAFVESVPVTHLHVFRYSPRPGTRSAAAASAPPGESRTVRRRSERLRALAEAKRAAFERSLVGTRRSLVMEARRAPDGAWLGTSDLYATVALDERPDGAGPIPARVTAQRDGILRGTAAER